jgi:GNAT superfamily N-acetyltransferase
MGGRVSQKNDVRPKNEIKVRRATAADVKILVPFAKKEILKASHYNAAARQTYSSQVSSAYMRGILKGAGFAVLAFKRSEPVGCLWTSFDSADRSIMTFEWILVNRRYKKQGIAKLMHNFAERLAVSQGVRKIWGDSRASNYQAIALGAKLDVRRIGKLKKHWFGQDYILWEKQLR